ncbi:ABC transporter G family member 8 [Gossypium arboreum]|uniref:ABC transporter G family member 8 n=1 Tax=Gossypium arboreum TaxID=29729 RepID=A0A0B0PMA2_GOSAR|nr:ABC transporter G family member 8 [Gossypium arboreum]
MEDQLASSSPPPPSPALKTYTLTASSVSYTKSTTSTTSLTGYFLFKPCTSTPPTYILRDVSFTANPSQILAIVGPSGAGKSTLLDILAARTSATNGILLLNSTPINPSSFRKLSAYVPQHDACLPLLTVAETFAFAARLLVPKTSDVDTTVTSLLSELSLTHLSNTKLSHGLSGGERRRVSIGLSLLHDPAVLLLDEPTSGLDSTSAFNVMQILKSIAASRHRTVVLSIHQPSFKILSTIDRILLLSKGTVVHHGTLFSLEAFLSSNGFTVPPQLNALEYAMEILNQLHANKPITPPSLPPSQQESVISPDNKEASDVRPILLRETSSGVYRLSSYLIANTLVFLPYLLAIAIIYSISVYFLVGLCASWQAFAYFVLVIWIIVLMANSFVLFLSSLAPNYIAGTSLVTILLGSFFLFSGYFISKDSMPKYWLFMHFFSMYKYALDALLINEYSCLVSRCFLWYNETSTCMISKDARKVSHGSIGLANSQASYKTWLDSRSKAHDIP